jgi:hypothetical protein
MNLYTSEKVHKEYSKEVPPYSNSHVENDMDAIKYKIEKRKQKQKKQKIIFFTLIGLVGFFAILFGYSQYRLHILSREESTILPTTSDMISINASSTPETIIKAVSRHILLPTGTPQIAQIQDVTKLKQSQPFFKDAQNGDIIIVYETMIFMYRPSRDIVIATGDISGVGQINP